MSSTLLYVKYIFFSYVNSLPRIWVDWKAMLIFIFIIAELL